MASFHLQNITAGEGEGGMLWRGISALRIYLDVSDRQHPAVLVPNYLEAEIRRGADCKLWSEVEQGWFHDISHVMAFTGSQHWDLFLKLTYILESPVSNDLLWSKGWVVPFAPKRKACGRRKRPAYNPKAAVSAAAQLVWRLLHWKRNTPEAFPLLPSSPPTALRLAKQSHLPPSLRPACDGPS